MKNIHFCSLNESIFLKRNTQMYNERENLISALSLCINLHKFVSFMCIYSMDEFCERMYEMKCNLGNLFYNMERH